MVRTDNIVLILNKEFTERKDKGCSLEFIKVKYNDIVEDIVKLNYGENLEHSVTYKRECYNIARGIRKIDIEYMKSCKGLRQISSHNIHNSIDLWNFINSSEVIVNFINTITITSDNYTIEFESYEEFLDYYYERPTYQTMIWTRI